MTNICHTISKIWEGTICKALFSKWVVEKKAGLWYLKKITHWCFEIALIDARPKKTPKKPKKNNFVFLVLSLK